MLGLFRPLLFVHLFASSAIISMSSGSSLATSKSRILRRWLFSNDEMKMMLRFSAGIGVWLLSCQKFHENYSEAEDITPYCKITYHKTLTIRVATIPLYVFLAISALPDEISSGAPKSAIFTVKSSSWSMLTGGFAKRKQIIKVQVQSQQLPSNGLSEFSTLETFIMDMMKRGSVWDEFVN